MGWAADAGAGAGAGAAVWEAAALDGLHLAESSRVGRVSNRGEKYASQ